MEFDGVSRARSELICLGWHRCQAAKRTLCTARHAHGRDPTRGLKEAQCHCFCTFFFLLLSTRHNQAFNLSQAVSVILKLSSGCCRGPDLSAMVGRRASNDGEESK